MQKYGIFSFWLLIILNAQMLFAQSEPIIVHFNSYNLEQVVREELKKPTGDITDADMAELTELRCSERGVDDLTGLEYAVNLILLGFYDTGTMDLTPLQGLIKLEKLILDGSCVTDLTPLRNLKNLVVLNLGHHSYGNYLRSLSGLEQLSNLEYLYLQHNELNNEALVSLYNLDKLTNLNLYGNPGITSGTAVQTLADNLDNLSCSDIKWDGTCGVDPDLAAISSPKQKKYVYLNEKVTVKATATNSSGRDVQMQIDWGDGTVSDWTDYKSSGSGFEFTHAYSAAGSYSVKVIARDTHKDKTAWSDPVTVTVKNTNSAPSPKINSISPNPVEAGQSLQVEATATDEESENVLVIIDWGDDTDMESSALQTSGSSFFFTHSYAAAGAYQIRILAEDASELQSLWTEPQEIVVIRANTAPAAQITHISPNPAEPGATVTVQATAQDVENDSVQLQIDWGDGAAPAAYTALQASSSPFSLTHAYSTAGSYPVKVRAKDNLGAEGEWTAVQTVTVEQPNTAPVCTITNVSPNPAQTGATVTVQALVQDGEGHRVRAKINWGDGEETNYTNHENSGTTFYFSHSYSQTGEFEIKVTARDEMDLGGEWSEPKSITVFAPNTAPVAVISSVAPASVETGETVTVQATITDSQSDPVQAKIDWGDGAVTDYSALQASGSTFTFTHSYAAAGSKTIRVMGRDSQGNEGTWSTERFVQVSAAGTPLEASITAIEPNPASVNETVTVRATAADKNQKQVQMKIAWGDEETTYSALKASGEIFEFTRAFADTGQVAVKVMAKNTDGAESEWSEVRTLSVTRANRAPKAVITELTPNPSATNKPVTAKFTATDPDGHQVQIKIDWGDGRIADFAELKSSGSVFEFTPAYSAAGTFKVRVAARDEQGLASGWSDSTELVISAPNFAPTAAIHSVTPNPAAVGASITLQAKATDTENDSVQCRVDWGDGAVSDYSEMTASGTVIQFSHAYATAGSYQVKVMARDKTGLTGNWSAALGVVVNPANLAPSAFVKSLSPLSANIGQTVSLAVQAADDNNDKVQVQVDWGDGEVSAYSALEAPGFIFSYTHAYSVSGQFAIKVRGKDFTGAEGEWSGASTVSINKPNTTPVAEISKLTPNPVETGLAVSLEATAADSTDDTVQLKVSWGDGTISAYSNFQACGSVFGFSHTFTAAGEYSVKVAAKDAQGLEGSWTAPQMLTVVKPNSAPKDTIVSVSPQQPAAGQEVTVQARATDEDNESVQMKITWGDGTVSDYSELKPGGSLFSFTHAYSQTGNYQIYVSSKDARGLESMNQSKYEIIVQTTSVANGSGQVYEFALMQNFPNPFNNTTTIHYSLKEAAEVIVCVFDTNGKRVKTLVSGEQKQGLHQIHWHGCDEAGMSVSSGIYLVRMNTKGRVFTKKVILLK